MFSPSKVNLDLNFSNALMKLHLDNTDRSIITRWMAGRHCNAEYEVHILLAGSCSLDIEEETLRLNTSDAVFIAPGRFHYPHNISEEFLRFSFSFQTDSEELNRQLFAQIPMGKQVSLPAPVIHLCYQILDEAVAADAFRQEALSSMFVLLLVHLFRNLEIGNQPGRSSTVYPVDSRICIMDTFFSPWPDSFGTEDDLAAKLNLSRRQINRILIQTYGMGFRQKMLQSRMEYASMLLCRTDKAVGEIATLVGYTAESSFYKAFNHYYHISPSEYRKRERILPSGEE